MRSGTIYIKRRLTSGDKYGSISWVTVKERHYTSVAQRKQLINALAKRFLVNNINIVISVIPRDKNLTPVCRDDG